MGVTFPEMRKWRQKYYMEPTCLNGDFIFELCWCVGKVVAIGAHPRDRVDTGRG